MAGASGGLEVRLPDGVVIRGERRGRGEAAAVGAVLTFPTALKIYLALDPESNCAIPGRRSSIHVRSTRLVVLPTLSHTMAGAVASRTERAAKSSSLVMMIAPLFTA